MSHQRDQRVQFLVEKLTIPPHEAKRLLDAQEARR
jgi:hypothetical protein